MPTQNPQEPFARVTVDEAKEMMTREDVTVVDVRDPHEYGSGHVPGAGHIPVNSVFARKDELPKDRDIVFVCAVGARSALACEMAAAAGLTRLYNLEGGTDAWIKSGNSVES